MINENDILDDFCKDCLKPFYTYMYAELLAYAKKLLNEADRFLAEDCVQNAVLQAWKRKKNFDSIQLFKSFLYVTIRNEVINLYRKNSAKEKYIAELEDETFLNNSMIEQEVHHLLYKAVEQLPEKYRTIFEMSFMEGLKNNEIAKILEISESSVEKNKAQALRILRERLNPIIFMLFWVLKK